MVAPILGSFAILIAAQTAPDPREPEPMVEVRPDDRPAAAEERTRQDPQQPMQSMDDEAARRDAPRRPAPAPRDRQTMTPTQKTAVWMVDLARHQGHRVGRADPRSASLHVLALLKAATQIAPDVAEAWYWLYDLQFRMGDVQAARRALDQYVRLNPDDESARLRHLELALADRQTAETRLEYVTRGLEQPNLSRPYKSELYRWLAKFHFERRNRDEAARAVEAALRLNPMNLAARELAYDMFSETDATLQRVEMALQLISINPSQTNLVWELGEFLDRLSLHRHAQEWYNRAIEMHRRAEVGEIPARFWHQLALSYACSGDHEKAREAADAALAVDPHFHSARLLKAGAQTRLGNTDAADADKSFVEKAYQQLIEEAADAAPGDEAAEIAWFFAYHRPDPAKALQIAERAIQAPNPSSLARLAYGYALEMNGQVDQAIEVLEPLVVADQLAAWKLGQIYRQRGEKDKAIDILRKAATLQHSGFAYDLIADLLADLGGQAPAPPERSKIIAALDKFQRDVFDYHKRPRDFLQFSMRFENEPLPATGPIRVTFRMENVGPFAITFGEGFMVRPLVALDAQLGGQQGASFDDFLQVMLNERLLLLPGDAMEKVVSVDVGPFRTKLLRSVTQTQDLALTAMFDPIYIDGELTSGLGTITAGPIRAVRPGITANMIDGVLARAGSADVNERMIVAETIGSLLATMEHAPDTANITSDMAERLQVTLAELLGDEQWTVRARALVAAGWSTLDTRARLAAAPAVRSSAMPILKLLAVRLFAEQDGEKFREGLELLAEKDPDEAVRMMARSYLPEPARVQANRETAGP